MKLAMFGIAALTLAGSVAAQERHPTVGVAGASLVSQTPSSAITLAVDPGLTDGRLSIRIVAVNGSKEPRPFGPAAIAIAVGGKPVMIATADQILKRPPAPASRDSALARASAAPVIQGFGQRDNMGATNPLNAAAGVPDERFVRPETAPPNENVGARAVRDSLLKTAVVAPRASLGGALLTDKVGRKPKEVDVTVTFAGEIHGFVIKMP